MRLLFNLPEGVAEQDLRPQPRIHASMDSQICMLAKWSVEPRRWRSRSSFGGQVTQCEGCGTLSWE